jgi:hypothetical protein
VDDKAVEPLPVPVEGNEVDCFITVPVDFSKVRWSDDEEEEEEARRQRQFLGSPLRIPKINKASSSAAENAVEILGSPLRIPKLSKASSSTAENAVEIVSCSDTGDDIDGGKEAPASEPTSGVRSVLEEGTALLKTPSGKSSPLSTEGRSDQRGEAETDNKDKGL